LPIVGVLVVKAVAVFADVVTVRVVFPMGADEQGGGDGGEGELECGFHICIEDVG
jgi:hypothetical protein